MAKKKINNIYLIGVIILIAAVVIVGWQIYKSDTSNGEILRYKKAFYEAVLCEYSCPLKLHTINNKTQLLPEAGCVKTCTEDFRKMQNVTYKKEDLNKDNLALDMADVIKNCGTQTLNNETGERNNSEFFSCSVRDLRALRDKYNYL